MTNPTLEVATELRRGIAPPSPLLSVMQIDVVENGCLQAHSPTTYSTKIPRASESETNFQLLVNQTYL